MEREDISTEQPPKQQKTSNRQATQKSGTAIHPTASSSKGRTASTSAQPATAKKPTAKAAPMFSAPSKKASSTTEHPQPVSNRPPIQSRKAVVRTEEEEDLHREKDFIDVDEFIGFCGGSRTGDKSDDDESAAASVGGDHEEDAEAEMSQLKTICPSLEYVAHIHI